MSNFLHFRHEQQGLDNRFDIENGDGYTINGLRDWKNLISRLEAFLSTELPRNNEKRKEIREKTLSELFEITRRNNFNFWENVDIENLPTDELIVTLLLFRLRHSYAVVPRDSCPRLFISHRQLDEKFALRIAHLAQKNKFSYWLDVLDPSLQHLQRTGVSERLHPLVIACIIEMALINCTHVIACMTPQSRGSLWLPYEYGRITELPGSSKKAAAWLHPNLARKDFPEYMLLGEFFRKEDEIERWLETEWHLLNKTRCNYLGGDSLEDSRISKLPTKADDEAERRIREFEIWLDAGMPLLESLKVWKVRIKSKRDRFS